MRQLYRPGNYSFFNGYHFDSKNFKDENVIEALHNGWFSHPSEFKDHEVPLTREELEILANKYEVKRIGVKSDDTLLKDIQDAKERLSSESTG